MENRISIPEPCHEDWNNMLPEEQGRHCLSCCKTVVDFSGWEADRILTYLQDRKEERVCGRFNTEQVIPAAIAGREELAAIVIRSGVPFLRKIAAVIVICFGLLTTEEAHAQKIVGKPALPRPNSEHTHKKGKIAVIPADTTSQNPPPKCDTLQPKPQIIGMIAPYHPPKKEPVKKASGSGGTKKSNKN